MRHHSDSDPHDALNDYLDTLAGVPPNPSRAGDLDPDLRDGVDRFFDLAEAAGMATHHARRPAMNATLPASSVHPAPRVERQRGFTMPAWTQHLHLLSTGLLIITVAALSFVVFGPNGPGRGDDEGSGNFAAVPVATVPPDAETSTLPYPGPEQCTVEPMTRAELIAHIQEANVATEPERPFYEQSIEPSDDDAQAIMQAFDEWRACGLDTPDTSPAQQLRLQTPWFSANQLGVFYDYAEGDIERPISEEEIEAYADVLLDGILLSEEEAEMSGLPGGTPPSMHAEATPETLPIPAGATPVTYEGGRAFPTIFAEDIVITGPDTARVEAYAVDERTREVQASDPWIVEFVKVDGQWLLNEYREGGPQG